MDCSSDVGWIYLAHERQFQDQSLNIFKIGKTDNIKRRPSQYPKYTKFVFSYYCSDIKIIENAIKAKFPVRFIARTDYGSEYFQGEYRDIIDEMIKIIHDHNTYNVVSNTPEVPVYKTVRHFLNESVELINDYKNGLTLNEIHTYYRDIWLSKNLVEIPYFDQKEFLKKICKILGNPIKINGNLLFLGRKFIDKNYSKRLIDVWHENIEYTGDAYDRVSNEDIFELINGQFKGIDKKTMKNTLKTYQIVESNKTFNYNGKTYRGYIGYKFKK